MSTITRIIKLLDDHYGRQVWPGRQPVLDQLIMTVLSQNTSAANYRAAFARLRERFGDWDEVRVARVEEIADAIRVGGLANRKAPRIKRILEELHGQQGNLDLDWIADRPIAEAVGYLLEFDGVGRKTAACVLMFALGSPVFPVDTHVHRIAHRLGLIPKVSADQAHDLLQAMIPDQDVYTFHINLVTHGRELCHAISPKCPICPLKQDCDYYHKQGRTQH